MKHFKAIAAMSENRVIGSGNRIPWHLPEDFKWFKQLTTGHVIVMGRKTFRVHREAPAGPRNHCAQPLALQPSRSEDHLRISAASILRANPGEVFICGGAEIYALALPFCSDLYLTLVKRTVEGDVFFPPFEEMFRFDKVLMERPEFEVRHY